MRHKMLTQRTLIVMAKKGTLSQHFVTHVGPPLSFCCLSYTGGVDTELFGLGRGGGGGGGLKLKLIFNCHLSTNLSSANT